MTIGIYNVRAGESTHVVVLEEMPGHFRVGFVGLPDAYAPIAKCNTTSIVMSLGRARNPQDAVLLTAVSMPPYLQG